MALLAPPLIFLIAGGCELYLVRKGSTPAVVAYEVYKKIKRERGEEMAKLCVAQMEKTRGVPLDQNLALRAADVSLEFSLPMADSFVLATARALDTELISSDAEFRNVPGVRIL
jgi:toxin FitB